MNAILRYPGAKWSVADKIIRLFPEHKSYFEPYFGSGAILFNKAPSRLETVNDIDSEVVNFFEVLRTDYKRLQDKLRLTPYSREFYMEIRGGVKPIDKFERAYRFFIMSWMAHAGYQPNKTAWSHCKEPSGPNKAFQFAQSVDALNTAVERLRNVMIDNQDAIELIKKHDFKGTLIYLDPPYVLTTRKSNLYKHELEDSEHKRLLETIVSLKKAKVVISGYDNDLYNELLANWSKQSFASVDGCAQTKVEVVWFNYQIEEQQSLF